MFARVFAGVFAMQQFIHVAFLFYFHPHTTFFGYSHHDTVSMSAQGLLFVIIAELLHLFSVVYAFHSQVDFENDFSSLQ